MFIDPDAPVQPNQYAIEFRALLDLLQPLKPKRILEIGVYQGGTLYQWLKLVGSGGVVCAIDLPGGAWGKPDTAKPEEWQRWADELGVMLNVHIGNSHDMQTWLLALKDAPFDLIFIDGDHSYAGAWNDYEDYSPLIAPGGVISLHDILYHPNDPGIGVHRLWMELKRSNKTLELTSHPDQTEKGIGVCLF